MVDQGWGAYGEFAYGEHAFDGVASSPITSSDGLTLDVAESADVLATLLRADMVTVTLAGDSALAAALARADTLSTVLTETTDILSALERADNVTLLVANENAVLALLVSDDETALVLFDEVVGSILAALTRTDTIHPMIYRVSRGQGFGAYGEFAYGEHNDDTNLLPPLRERSDIFARLNRTDMASIDLVETPEITAALAALDTVIALLDEIPGRAEPRLSRRIINIIRY